MHRHLLLAMQPSLPPSFPYFFPLNSTVSSFLLQPFYAFTPQLLCGSALKGVAHKLVASLPLKLTHNCVCTCASVCVCLHSLAATGMTARFIGRRHQAHRHCAEVIAIASPFWGQTGKVHGTPNQCPSNCRTLLIRPNWLAGWLAKTH